MGADGDWSSLLEHQTAFGSCDDGELGEGYSEAVTNLFAKKWGQFDTFVALAETHPDFKSWAIRHIDASASDSELNKIILNASTCINSSAVGALCRAIRQTAANALKESTRARW